MSRVSYSPICSALKNRKWCSVTAVRNSTLRWAKGEIDVRANGADTMLQRNRDGQLDYGFYNFTRRSRYPKAYRRGLPKAPELETFAKTDRERQLINLFRTFLYPRWPYLLPPATPKEIVAIAARRHDQGVERSRVSQRIQKTDGHRRHAAHRRGLGDAIRELPRDPEIVALYKKIADQGPLPAAIIKAGVQNVQAVQPLPPFDRTA